MWVFIPRVPRRVLFLAAATAGPAALLGALANLLVLSELAVLDVWPGAGSDPGRWQQLAAFREHVEVLLVGLVVVLGLATLTVIHFSRSAVVGLNLWGSALVALLAFAVLNEWTLGGPQASSARLGMGTALWGLGWVLVTLNLYGFFRAVQRRHWAWTTIALGTFFAGVNLVVVLFGALVSVETVALFVFLVAALASFIVVMDRGEVARLWGYAGRHSDSVARPSFTGLPLVALYGVLVFGLIGAAYQHHFDYRPQAGMGHFLLLALAFVVGVPLFGFLTRREGRRTLLLLVPLTALVPIVLQLVQQQYDLMWALALAEGIMFAAVPFLLQYLAEATGRFTRGSAFLFSMGAVLTMGAGASIVAQLSGIEAVSPDLLLSLQIAAFLGAMFVAFVLPETRAQVSTEEEIEDYLAVAKRVTQENR